MALSFRMGWSAARRVMAALAMSSASSALLVPSATAQGEVNIYSYREPQLIDPLLKAFNEQTGIRTNVVYASAGLNERLAAEGQNSRPAVHRRRGAAIGGQRCGANAGRRPRHFAAVDSSGVS
jgi:hypothetical protein